jgi:hypothetical protein
LISLFSRLKIEVSATPVSSKKVRLTPLIFTGIKIKLAISLKGITVFLHPLFQKSSEHSLKC